MWEHTCVELLLEDLLSIIGMNKGILELVLSLLILIIAIICSFISQMMLFNAKVINTVNINREIKYLTNSFRDI